LKDGKFKDIKDLQMSLDGKKSRGSGTRLKGGFFKLKKERYKKEES